MNRVFRNSFVFLAVFIACIAGRSARSQEEFTLDNAHTSMIFSISHFRIGYLFGRFNLCAGSVTIDRNAPQGNKFKFAIASHSIDTNDDARDTALKGSEYFDVERFPSIEFESSSVVVVDGMYEVTGKLKMHGLEKEIMIPLQLLGVGKGPMDRTRMGMMGKFRIIRSEFGMERMLENLGDEVAITFCFEAVKNE